jgi:hypothetical protein
VLIGDHVVVEPRHPAAAEIGTIEFAVEVGVAIPSRFAVF